MIVADAAASSAETRHRYGISLADSPIASTSMLLEVPCVADDLHLRSVKDIGTR